MTPPPFRAGLVRRWHCNPSLAHLTDTVASHSGRMAALACVLWPEPSAALFRAIACHDLGEIATGDVPWPVKQDPALKAALDRLEAQALRDMGLAFHVGPDDARRLKLLDRLDAYLFVTQYAPHALDGDGWPAAKAWLFAEQEEIVAPERIVRLARP